MSKPNLLYYFRRKEDIHATLIQRLLDTWLAPLRELDDIGDPMTELRSYIRRKLEMARDFPQRKPAVRQRDPARRAAHHADAGRRAEGRWSTTRSR